MVSKGLPWRHMTDSAPCGSLQKLITSPSNWLSVTKTLIRANEITELLPNRIWVRKKNYRKKSYIAQTEFEPVTYAWSFAYRWKWTAIIPIELMGLYEIRRHYAIRILYDVHIRKVNDAFTQSMRSFRNSQNVISNELNRTGPKTETIHGSKAES